MKLALLAPVLLLAVGCRPKAQGYVPVAPPVVPPVAAKDVQDARQLLPIDLDDRWTYRIQASALEDGKPVNLGEDTVEYRVVDVRSDDTAVLNLTQGGKVIDRQGWRVSAERLEQLSGGPQGVPYTPPQTAIQLPLTPGTKFTWSGRGAMSDGSVAQAQSESEILESQSVDTGIGTLAAIPVVSRTTFGRSKSVNTAWFRPGVGLVRLRQETTGPSGRTEIILLTLKSYVLKQ